MNRTRNHHYTHHAQLQSRWVVNISTDDGLLLVYTWTFAYGNGREGEGFAVWDACGKRV